MFNAVKDVAALELGDLIFYKSNQGDITDVVMYAGAYEDAPSTIIGVQSEDFGFVTRDELDQRRIASVYRARNKDLAAKAQRYLSSACDTRTPFDPDRFNQANDPAQQTPFNPASFWRAVKFTARAQHYNYPTKQNLNDIPKKGFTPAMAMIMAYQVATLQLEESVYSNRQWVSNKHVSDPPAPNADRPTFFSAQNSYNGPEYDKRDWSNFLRIDAKSATVAQLYETLSVPRVNATNQL